MGPISTAGSSRRPAVQQGQWVELKGNLAVPNCALSEVTIYAEGPPAGVDLLVDNVTARAPNT